MKNTKQTINVNEENKIHEKGIRPGMNTKNK
jgi:hypothetical protein